MEKQKALESKLSDKEEASICSPSPKCTLWKEISVLRSAINCLLPRDVERIIKYTKQRFYAYRDKPGKSLSIVVIVDAEGNGVYENKLMNDCLYSSERTRDVPPLTFKLFAEINLATTSEKQKSLLNGPITRDGVVNAIKNLQSGKSSGPDGFCCEFYKEFRDLLLEPLLEIIHFLLQNYHRLLIRLTYHLL